MFTDPTNYPRPLEPTQGVYYNPYERTSPYYGNILPPPPPPPPEQSHKGLIVALVSVICLIVLLGGGFFTVMHFNTQQHVTQVTPTSVPTVLLTPTLNQNYTAADMMNDFHTNGLPTSQEDYTQSLNQFLDAFGGTGTSELTVKTLPTSYVFFRDPTVCVGGCDTGGDTWLGVYSSVTDAQASHNEVEQYTQYTNNAGNIPAMRILGLMKRPR